MGAHLIDGEFQSDKYPTTPRGKVPLSVKDVAAQPLLWEYAQRHRSIDAEFSDDLETALHNAGYKPREIRTKQDLLPHEVVVDLVLNYSPKMPMAGQAAVLSGSLMMLAKNHRGEGVTFGVPIHFNGVPFDGDASKPPYFVLHKIAPTVWKLSPSIKHAMLHAYVTIVGVPEGGWFAS
jgi:hypothetical protein